MPIITGPAFALGAGPAYIGAMRQRRLTRTASATSSDAAFPLTNLDDYIHPVRRWQATATTDQRVTLDLGASTEIGAIFLGWLDAGGASYVRLQVNDADSWGSPALDWNIPISDALNPLTGRYTYAYVPDPGALAYRYCSLLIPSHTGTPGSLGQFEVLDGFGVIIPQRPPLAYGWTQPVQETVLQSGYRERVALGPKRLTLSFDWEFAYNYQDESTDPEDALLEDTNIHAELDDHILVVRDIRYLPNFSAIFQMMGGGAQISSSRGVGANMPLSYEEVLG